MPRHKVHRPGWLKGLSKKEKPSDSHQTVSASKPKHPIQVESATSSPAPESRVEGIIRSSDATDTDAQTEGSQDSFHTQSQQGELENGFEDELGYERDVTPENEAKPGDDPQDKPDAAAQYKWTALWSAAYEKLGDEDRDLLKRYETEILKQSEKSGQKGTTDADTGRQQRMEAIIRQELDKLEAKQLTVEFKDKTVYVRDGMRRVVQGILASKDLISAIISTEPHASVVWAGVLLVLPLMLNPITQEDDATAGFEFISALLVRYRPIQSQIWKGSNDVPASDKHWLKRQIVSVYAEVLRYHARFLKQYHESSRMGRYLRDVFVADN
ncbi:uncharacterized protein BO72DRAFT_518475 [Aspergillus fijiensis CBS 313.89]|uniref:NWD NACHT-NTPase N-terminal domain-containing protein n=1 Tax=Aspergillus fijiensis CBS 313.89 TaxID=1448319 RepID=A0A8G1S2E2_9EURO|nr:uncharacterized protein BO72DRAFT_518475 [Aspergillus fijiensis CBS 313.89]RAK81186.1 hypothetical protein BO72DRAFT_518475 [Aspergillus fijiensis CBS 313.89]